MTVSELCFLTARELARRIREKDVSCVEVMEAHLAQIERVNPKVNAIVTLLPERAMDGAKAADAALARGDDPGPLHGLPVAHKDLVPTKGIRTTRGSPIFADWVPEEDGLIVERLRAAGAITIGKTNTPEFGAGSQTSNEVFGETLNPYDLGKTCGGSSGGAAVALACGMLPIADGSDHGGSLRCPGNFNNVVGFRPSPGRVPIWPRGIGWYPLGVQGPMARTVADAALMLSAIAGPDPRSPIADSEPGAVFARPLERDFKGVRVAWSRDLGGLPVDPGVTRALEAQRHVLEDLGCIVEDVEPELKEAEEVFSIWRAWYFQVSYGPLIEAHREQVKDTVIWNAAEGEKLSGADLGRAEVLHTQLFERMRLFMERYEFLLCPVNQALPFPVEQRFIDEINGVKLPNYIAWMASCYHISVLTHPAVSVPCGFTGEGLPVGLQIVGRCRADFAVLQLAHAFEQATRTGERRPRIAL